MKAMIALAALALSGCACPPAANRAYVEYIDEYSADWRMTDDQRFALNAATKAELTRLDEAESANE